MRAPDNMLFCITTLGCKANQYDSAAISEAVRLAGLTSAEAKAMHRCDLTIINTCCVTATAMRKSRGAIRRSVRRSPNTLVLVTGCYVDYAPESIASVLSSIGVSKSRTFIAAHHGDLSACIRDVVSCLRTGQPSGVVAEDCPAGASIPPNQSAPPPAPEGTLIERRRSAVQCRAPGTRLLGPIRKFPNRQRAFVKVQDGCDAFCTYCVVPYTRPNMWSRPIDQVQQECRDLVASGHKEIVLSGVFLGAYGRDTAVRRKPKDHNNFLCELILRISSIPDLWRVRLSSIDPLDVTDELLSVCGSLPNFAPHFHLPAQSGSQRILQRMNRRYTPGQYLETVRRIREAFDRPAITTDVIVAFPGEQEQDFEQTLELARLAEFAKIHAFPYSPIQGTASWSFRHESASAEIVRRRMSVLGQLERTLAHRYKQTFMGKTVEAIVEKPPRGGRRGIAMTDRYVTVAFPAPENMTCDLTGKVVRLIADSVTDEGLDGRIENTQEACKMPPES